MNTKPSIYVGIPAFGGMLHADFAMSLFGLGRQLSKLGIPTSIDIASDMMVTLARNYLANRFLRSAATHLLFVDADIVFRPDDVVKMIETQKDVIGLPCSKKMIDWRMIQRAFQAGVHPETMSQIAGGDLCLNLLLDNPPRHFDLDKLLEVKAIGTGVMLISRQVFSKLADRHPEWRLKDDEGKPVFAFFQPGIDEETRQYLTEDYWFCHQWRKLGGHIYCLPSAVTRHIGRQEFICNIAAMKALEQAVAQVG